MSSTISPYGSWSSPITLDLVTSEALSFVRELHEDPVTDSIFWAELHSSDSGRFCVFSFQESADPPINKWTRAPFNVRSRVHEYGGGAFFAYNGVLYFSNFSDQRLYQQKGSESTPEPITDSGVDIRYADGHYSPPHQQIYIVCEDHTKKVKDNAPQNYLLVINPETKKQNVLVSGADFYSSPRVSKDGKKICWVQWDFPNMPWDDTEIWVADLDETGKIIKKETKIKVAGDNNVSVMLPSWTLDGKLMYIGDQTNWWNIYLVDNGIHQNLHPVQKEIGGPQWQFGGNAYQEDPTGSRTLVTTFKGELGLVNLDSRKYRTINTSYSLHSSAVIFSAKGLIYNFVASPGEAITLIQIDPNINKIEIIKASMKKSMDLDYISIPKSISFKTRDNDIAHGNLYLPKNAKFQPVPGTLPPLLVRSHGGPTSEASTALNLEIQYFTSRGFALLDVDYRGSTGYGREYRNKLQGNWGIHDREDCCSGALHLVEEHLVDGQKLCTDGRSAGGYTTLACLTFDNVFKAGVSHFGVSNLEGLAKETHKFESQYLDLLIGKYPEQKELYFKRSPINFVNKINAALAFFQGGKDKIVLPNQAELMFEAVKAKNLPTAYVLFPEEQHGFVNSENRKKALGGEFYFYSKIFNFTPSKEDEIVSIDIHNLECICDK